MRNLAVITARSGSKGLKDKNIRELCGKPLIVYTIDAAIKSGVFSSVMVSTDSEAYAEIARRYGAEVPFLRFDKTSTDTAGSWEVVDEVLQRYKEMGKCFDTVCILQPTSPLRQADDIANGYKLLEERNADAVTAVCEAEHSAGAYLTLPYDGSMRKFRQEKGYYQPRQIQERLYRINGALYIRRVTYGADGVYTIMENERAYIMPRNRSIDIDDEMDFKIAEMVMKTER